MDLDVVRAVSAALHSSHRFVYFAPEALEEAQLLGVTEPGPAYFALRSAALGAVSWRVTHAIFYNFSPRAVQAMDGVWEAASPSTWQTARFSAVRRAVDRAGVRMSPAQISDARALLDPVVSSASYAARPLAAANAAVELPADPLVALWQQITVLREWRGDAHVSILDREQLGPCACNVMQAAVGGFPTAPVARATRLWSDDEWEDAVQTLAHRGWLADDGTATPLGVSAREQIERDTDAQCAELWKDLDDAQAARLIELIAPLTEAFVPRSPGRR